MGRAQLCRASGKYIFPDKETEATYTHTPFYHYNFPFFLLGMQLQFLEMKWLYYEQEDKSHKRKMVDEDVKKDWRL